MKKKMKSFRKLSKSEQTELRREYKSNCYKEYRYSINLFIIYVILGIIGVGGLFVVFLVNWIVGIIIYVVAFCGICILIFLLNKSNKPFYDFLEKKGLKK